MIHKAEFQRKAEYGQNSNVQQCYTCGLYDVWWVFFGGGGVGLEYLHQTLIYKIIDIHLSVAQQN